MNRHLGLIATILALGACVSHVPYPSVTAGPFATVKFESAGGKMSVIAFAPDANCDMQFVGRTIFAAHEPRPVWKMPPGRAYFRTSVKWGNTHLSLEDVSFVLEEGQEYTIEFKRLGKSVSWWQGQTIEYEYNYLNSTGEFPKPVTTDFFNVCERTQS